MQKNDLTAKRVLELMRYEPETGQFIWVSSRYSYLNGTPAGTVRKEGYRFITIDGFQYLAHRLAWLVTHGSWPEATIDHWDRDRDNNRIDNLRQATQLQNIQNQRADHRRSVSGLLGVSWSVSHKKWRADIMVNSKSHYLGRHDTKEKAHAAYLQAKTMLHPFQTITTQ